MRDEKLRLLALCGYPSDVRPTHQPFVRALLCALAAQGAEPIVLAPESWWARPRAPRFQLRDRLPIQRPRFPSSAVRLPGSADRIWRYCVPPRGCARERRPRPLISASRACCIR
jgi:hypothetical protein